MVSTMQDEHKQELSDRFSEAVQYLNRRLNSDRVDEWERSELTIPQIKTLLLLREMGPSRMGVISLHLGRALSATTTVVDRLVVRDLGGAVGRASALKMCYAAVTKGTSALQFAQLAAASRLGVDTALAAELAESQSATYAGMQRALPGLPARAPRWIEEMRQIAATFESVGVPGDFHRGAAALYELLSATPFADEPEEAVDTSRTLETTVAALTEICARRNR